MMNSARQNKTMRQWMSEKAHLPGTHIQDLFSKEPAGVGGYFDCLCDVLLLLVVIKHNCDRDRCTGVVVHLYRVQTFWGGDHSAEV